jgi:hypothetical protein
MFSCGWAVGLFEVLPSEFISDFSLVSMPVIDLECASKCFMMVVDCLSQNDMVLYSCSIAVLTDDFPLNERGEFTVKGWENGGQL